MPPSVTYKMVVEVKKSLHSFVYYWFFFKINVLYIQTQRYQSYLYRHKSIHTYLHSNSNIHIYTGFILVTFYYFSKWEVLCSSHNYSIGWIFISFKFLVCHKVRKTLKEEQQTKLETMGWRGSWGKEKKKDLRKAK